MMAQRCPDRDPSHFNIEAEECARRRRIWWECVAMDAWQVRVSPLVGRFR